MVRSGIDVARQVDLNVWIYSISADGSYKYYNWNFKYI